MRGIIACVALAACGSGSKESTTGNTAPAPAQLCVDVKAPGGTSLQLSRDEQPGVVGSDGDLGLAEADGSGRVGYAAVQDDTGAAIGVTAGQGCGERPCNPQMIRVEHGTVVARTPLPHGEDVQAGFDYPFLVDWLSIEDGDGDGTPEVWVSYNITSPPEAAVGSTTAEHVAVFSLPDLALRFAAQYAELPESGGYQRCTGELFLADANCDGQRDLVLTQRCAFGQCFEYWDTGEYYGGGDPAAECGDAPQVTGQAFVRQADGSYR